MDDDDVSFREISFRTLSDAFCSDPSPPLAPIAFFFGKVHPRGLSSPPALISPRRVARVFSPASSLLYPLPI